MSKHTPGPWHAARHNDYTGKVSVESANEYIADCDNKVDGGEIDEANARLIATAPDLLEALKEACTSVENQANWDKQPYSKWYYKAKQIIAKAECTCNNCLSIYYADRHTK